MDIICASCGRHFTSIESAREHRGHCSGAEAGEALHWISSNKEELTPEQKERLQQILDSNNEPQNSVESSQTWQVTPTAEKHSQPVKSGYSSPAQHNKINTSKPKKQRKPASRNMRGFTLSVILTFALSLIGLGVFLYTDNPLPLFLLLFLSFIFSMERWFRHLTSKYKSISVMYRILVNISVLALLIHIIWSSAQLFSGEINQNAIVQSLIFIFEFGLFVWLFTVLVKNSWRSPSLKLTIVALFLVFLVFAFAGVQPMTGYKDQALGFMESTIKNIKEFFQEDGLGLNSNIGKSPSTTPGSTSAIPKTTTLVDAINFSTGTYKNYFLGLVKAPDGVIGGNDCYGEFIVLINNQEARNPTYAELVEFLRTDTTDDYPYILTFSSGSFYYGSPESHMELERLKNIINGTENPRDPKVCADFAERLHNNAEKAGIRCGYISINFDDGIGHACNVFETIDSGIVYIDDTGHIGSSGPAYKDAIVDNIEVGKQYNPDFLFPSSGWYIPSGSMGVVVDFYITWDGNWN